MVPHAPFDELSYITGRHLRALATQVYPWNPIMRANNTDPNLGDDGETDGSFQLNGLLVTAWARFRWSGSGADGGSGRVFIEPPIPVYEDFMVLSDTGVHGNSAGMGQNRNDDNTPNNFILIVQFHPFDNNGINLQRSNNNSPGITAPAFFDSDGDALSLIVTYVGDPTAILAFLGVGGD